MDQILEACLKHWVTEEPIHQYEKDCSWWRSPATTRICFGVWMKPSPVRGC